MLRLTSRVSELFLEQSAVEQRRLLQVVVPKGFLAERGFAINAIRTFRDYAAFEPGKL